MKISNINCCKPRRRGSSRSSFTGANKNLDGQQKYKYKHLELASDEKLVAMSIGKAYSQTKESNKMRLFRALPILGGLGITTVLAIAQPGKLSTKIASGLGFLAFSTAFSKLSDVIVKKASEKQEKDGTESFDKQKNKRLMADVVSLTACTAAACLALTKGKSFVQKHPTKVSKFIQKEANQLANEINATKLGKSANKLFSNLETNHAKGFKIGRILTGAGILLGSTIGQVTLANSISKDFKKRAKENYANYKFMQNVAIEQFKSYDAEEI